MIIEKRIKNYDEFLRVLGFDMYLPKGCFATFNTDSEELVAAPRPFDEFGCCDLYTLKDSRLVCTFDDKESVEKVIKNEGLVYCYIDDILDNFLKEFNDYIEFMNNLENADLHSKVNINDLFK